MCGIAGALLSKDEGEVNIRGLATDLLLDIESRGKDATGAAWFDGPTVMVQKDALPARQFVPHLEIPTNARNVILHTRAQTQGTHRNNDNNHPVITGGIVGVHNGGVWNDDSLFRKMGVTDRRIGEVDTEAIFAAIAYGREIDPSTGKPRLSDDLLDILDAVNGSAAIAWLKVGGDPEVMEVARIQSSPLVWGQTRKGSFVFASTKEAIDRATKNNDLEIVHWDIAAEGDYMKIEGGRIGEYRTFGTSNKNTYSYSKTSHVYEKDEDKKSPKANGNGSGTNLIGEIEKPVNAPFISPTSLHARLCVVFDQEVRDAGTNFHYSWYKNREERIDEYIAAIGEDAGQPSKAVNQAGHVHAFARVGSWVLTDIGTYQKVRAQILLLPMSFPQGSYILRALIPNQRYHNDYEPVLIERQAHEFTMISNPEEAKSPENAE